MSLSFSAFKDEIERHLGNRDDIDDVRVARQLNLAQTRMARAFDFRELQAKTSVSITPSGVATTDKYYTFNVNLHTLYSVLFTESNRSYFLEWVPQGQWDRLISKPEELGTGIRATNFTVWDGAPVKLELWRVPSAAYSLTFKYSLWPTDFDGVTMSQTTDLKNKDDALLNLTVSQYFRSLGMSQQANEFFGIYKDMMKDAMDDDSQPGITLIPRGIRADRSLSANYANDPFVRSIERY